MLTIPPPCLLFLHILLSVGEKQARQWVDSPSPFGQFDKKVCKTKPNFFYDYEENVVDGHSFT